MPRRRKCRRICSMPETDGFEPIRENGTLYDDVILNIDEYEVIRLIDFENLTQEQCAVQMVVSRTTITSIYDGARFKIADALINSKKLVINGGEFILCEHNGECCGKGCKHNCFDDNKKHCVKECCQKIEVRERPEMMNIPILGIVENMSYYICPNCKEQHQILGKSHIDEITAKHGIKNIARIPINSEITSICDKGMIELFEGDWLDQLSNSIEEC